MDRVVQLPARMLLQSRTTSEDAVTAAATSSLWKPMKSRIRGLLRQRLSTQVVIMMVAILVVTMAAGFVVVLWNLNHQLDDQYEQRSLAVAQSLASQPGLQRAVRADNGGGDTAAIGDPGMWGGVRSSSIIRRRPMTP